MTDLYFEQTGSGEPIVFIHGFSLDHRMWQPQVAYFNDRHHVITYDARGFGKSPIPTDQYQDHDDLATLLADLNIESAHIVGLSMGGRIAINFALAYPKMVRTLAVIDSAVDGFTDPTDWRVHARTQGVEQAKRNWLAHPLFSATRNNPAALALCEEIVADYSGWHWLHTNLSPRPKPPALDRLHEVKAPTLVLVGQYDLVYFQEMAGAIAEGIPGAIIEVLPAGHMLNLELPNEVNAALARHL